MSKIHVICGANDIIFRKDGMNFYLLPYKILSRGGLQKCIDLLSNQEWFTESVRNDFETICKNMNFK